MGIDYLQLNAGTPTTTEAPKFNTAVVSGGKITVSWTGTGNLESASTLLGPWTPVTPTPASPYSESIVPNQNRFYRLHQP